MSGPVRPPLTVTESDGTPTIRPCSTISFNSADFVVVDNGTTARIDAHPGAGASLTDTEIGFGNASNLMTSSSKLTWNDTAGSEQLKVIGSGVTDGGIVIENTNTGAVSAPDLVLHRNVTGATNDFIGRIDMRGQDSSSNDVDYLMMTMKIHDAVNDAGRLGFLVSGNASLNADDSHLMIFGRSGLTANPGLVSINNSSRSDVDFRVNGDSVSLIRTDASQDNVGIGGAPDSAVERLHVKGSGDDVLVRFETDDTGAGSGPELALYRSATAATDDIVGQIRFQAKSATGSINITAATFYTKLKAVSGTAMDSELFCDIRVGNASKNMMKLGNSEVVFNDDSESVDFRVESDGNENMLFVDGSQNNVGIGTTPTSGYSGAVPMVHVLQPDNGIGILVEDNQADGDVGPQIVWYRNSASPAADDILARLRWEGKDSGGNQHMYGRQTNEIVSPTDGAESGRMIWESRSGGTLYETMRFEGNDITFNYAGSNAVDLLIKGDNDNILFADASQDNLGVGTSAPSSDVERLHIKGTSTGTLVRMESTDDSSSAAPTLEFYRNSATAATNDYLSRIYHTGNNASGVAHVYVQESSYIIDASAGAEDGLIYWQVMTGGTLREKMRMRESMVEVNALARDDCDFRVRGDTTSDLLFIDVSQDNIGVGATPLSGGAEFQVEADASFLLPINAYTANHDIAAYQAHGYALQMKTGAGTGTFTLPATGVVGMHVTCINFGSGMNVAVDASSSHKINGGGSAGNSTTATVTAAGARYDLVYIAADVWNCTAPAVVTAS